MKFLTILILLFHFNLYAQNTEADLNLPVSDVSEIQKQEEEIPPTIDEVEMKQKNKKTNKKKVKNEKTKTAPSSY